MRWGVPIWCRRPPAHGRLGWHASIAFKIRRICVRLEALGRSVSATGCATRSSTDRAAWHPAKVARGFGGCARAFLRECEIAPGAITHVHQIVEQTVNHPVGRFL